MARKLDEKLVRGAALVLVGLLAACPQAASVAPLEPGANPFATLPVYMNPWSRARNQAQEWRKGRPADAKLMDELGAQPVSLWFGDWTPDIESAIRSDVDQARKQGALALMVLYNIPNRDCGQYAAGGLGDGEAYRDWIRRAKRGMRNAPTAVILEPDALGQLSDCLEGAEQRERLELIADAVDVLSKGGQTAVYIDAGNAKWHAPELMAERLEWAGIARARGFALNVSNYVSTQESVAYGVAISERLGGKPFVIDTSRNGNGPTDDLEWCNPAGRAVGEPPTTQPKDPHVDAYVWAKVPGESDGECNGGPGAGEWWPQIAVELASNAAWVRRATGLAELVPKPATAPPASSLTPSPGPRR